MPFYFFQWSEEAIQHLAEHGVTQDEFTEVVMEARVIQTSRSTGLPIVLGSTSTGKRLACVFEWLDKNETEILPVTAYEI